MLDRFPPCNPEHGKSMAKVQQTAGKEHGKDMVILPCSPLFVLLPVRREPMSVQCTALPMCGGMRRKRKSHAGALRGYYAVSRPAAEPQRRTACGQASPMADSWGRLAQHRLNASSSFASTSPSKPALGRIAVRYVCTTGSSSTTRIFMARTLSSRLSVWSRRNRHAENLSLDLSTQTFPSVVGHLQECLHDLGIELASRPLRNFLPCCLQRLCRAVR